MNIKCIPGCPKGFFRFLFDGNCYKCQQKNCLSCIDIRASDVFLQDYNFTTGETRDKTLKTGSTALITFKILPKSPLITPIVHDTTPTGFCTTCYPNDPFTREKLILDNVKGECSPERCTGPRRLTRVVNYSNILQLVCDFCRDQNCQKCDPNQVGRCLECSDGYKIDDSFGCEKVEEAITFEFIITVLAITLAVLIMIILVSYIWVALIETKSQALKQNQEMGRLRRRKTTRLGTKRTKRGRSVYSSVNYGNFYHFLSISLAFLDFC